MATIFAFACECEVSKHFKIRLKGTLVIQAGFGIVFRASSYFADRKHVETMQNSNACGLPLINNNFTQNRNIQSFVRSYHLVGFL